MYAVQYTPQNFVAIGVHGANNRKASKTIAQNFAAANEIKLYLKQSQVLMKKHPIRKKPTPPAYAIGMMVEDYEWINYRYVSMDDGGCAVSLHREVKPEPQTQGEIMATAQKKNTPDTSKKVVAIKPSEKKVESKKQEVKKPEAKKAEAKKQDLKDSAKKPEAKKAEGKKPIAEAAASKDNFAMVVRQLLEERKRTDHELADEMAKRFPETPNVLSAVRWHRWKYNILLSKDGKPEVPVFMRDAGNKLVEKGATAPVQKSAPAKVEPKKVATKVAEVKKVEAAAPTKKTIIKKPIAKTAEA